MTATLKPPRTLLWLAAFAFAIRGPLALFRDPDALDRLFAPDDTYYTLTIARALAQGLGPSVDGGAHLTSGFQPLIAFLLVPLLAISHDATVAFRAALTLGALADACSAWLLAVLTLRFARRLPSLGPAQGTSAMTAATLAGIAWSLSSAEIAAALNGLETSLAITCVLSSLLAFDVALSARTTRSWLVVGAFLGLSLLARIDTVFLVAILGLLILLVVRSGRALAAAIAAAVAIVTPWWGYCLVHFKTIIPESGAAVREQAMMYRDMGMVIRDQIAWAAGAVVGPPLLDSTSLRQFLGSGASALGMILGIVVVAALVFAARAKALPLALRALSVHGVALFVFYSLYLPATWFFRRYLAPLHALSTFGLALGAAHLARVVSPRGQRTLRMAFTVIGSAAVVSAVVNLAILAISSPSVSVDQGHHGVKGYAEPARQVLALAPRGSVIGSFQSGALGWFGPAHGVEVVNLDGVVDADAARAVREHKLAELARARRVTHLADWEVNVKLFLARSGDPRIDRARLRPVGRAEPQGRDEQFVLYEIAWPELDEREP